MRIRVSIIAIGAVLSGAASAQPFNVSCVKGADERKIEIVSPGEVGAACDVQYTRWSAMKTPYHANNSAAFCREKAEEIVSTLITSGFACGQIGGPLTAEARPEPVTETADLAEPAPIEAAEPAIQPNEIAAPVPPAPSPAPVEEASAIETPEVATPADDVAVATQPTPTPDALVGAAPIEEPFASAAAPERFEPEPVAPPAADEPAVETALPDLQPDLQEEPLPPLEETALLTEPAADAVATRGPATLAGAELEDLPKVTQPVPTGRLIGAAPTVEAAPAPANPTVAAPASTPVQTATTVTPAVAATAAPARPVVTRSSPMRDPQDIIVATLHAQAAAWNEGNLQAFMETYWQDDDLKFVSGTAITRGWSQTLKRYRERYADDSGLGFLSFEKTDVEMVTDDVAVVTGRFNHVKNDEASSGVFSLVMKRINGVWRIVHDHTAGDPPRE